MGWFDEPLPPLLTKEEIARRLKEQADKNAKYESKRPQRELDHKLFVANGRIPDPLGRRYRW